MKKLLLIFVVSLVLGAGVDAFGFGGCEEDCMKCHSIEKSEVKDILTKLNAPNAEVLEIKMSPIKGLWEVAVEDQGKRGIMYVGFSKKYVMGGTIFEVSTASNRTQESMARMNEAKPRQVDFGKIPVDKALLMGSRDAKYKAVVFTDPDCPFCGKLHEELKKVVAERSDIAFHIKFLPLAMHPEARWKSLSVLCSKSLQRLEDNFAKKEIPRPDCESSEPDDNIALAAELGITGTPTMVLPDGRVIVGFRESKAIVDLLMATEQKVEK